MLDERKSIRLKFEKHAHVHDSVIKSILNKNKKKKTQKNRVVNMVATHDQLMGQQATIKTIFFFQTSLPFFFRRDLFY